MNLRQQVFKLYRRALCVYPKRFRATYGDEMLMAAYDMLQLSHSNTETLHIALRLGVDLYLTAAKERAKQTAGLAKGKTRRQIAITALQVLGMLVATYLFTMPIITIGMIMQHVPNAGSWYAELITAAIPASLFVLAFVVLQKARGAAFWSRLKWAYALGFGAAAAHIALSAADTWLMPPTYPLVIHLGNWATLVQTYGRSWVLAAMVGIGSYALTTKIRRRLTEAE